jgi:hypothetical protein
MGRIDVDAARRVSEVVGAAPGMVPPVRPVAAPDGVQPG